MDRRRTSRLIVITEGSMLMSSANSDKIKGRVKEAVGVMTDNQHLKNEGRTDQAVGKVKKIVERMIDKANK